MNYNLHNFQNGKVLNAKELNEMDKQISVVNKHYNNITSTQRMFFISDFQKQEGEIDDTGRMQRAIDTITLSEYGGTLYLNEALVIDGTVYIRKTNTAYGITIDGTCERGNMQAMCQDGAPRGFQTPNIGIIRNTDGVIFSVNIDENGNPYSTNREYDGLTIRNLLVYNNTYSWDGQNETFSAKHITFVKSFLDISTFDNILLFGMEYGFNNIKEINGVYGYQDTAIYTNIYFLYHLGTGFILWRADSGKIETVQCVPYPGFRQIISAESCNNLSVSGITYAQWPIYINGEQTSDFEVGSQETIEAGSGKSINTFMNMQVSYNSFHLEHLQVPFVKIINSIIELNNFYITYSSPELCVASTASSSMYLHDGFLDWEYKNKQFYYSPSPFQCKLERIRTRDGAKNLYNQVVPSFKYDIFPFRISIGPGGEFARIEAMEYSSSDPDRSKYEMKWMGNISNPFSYTFENTYGFQRNIYDALCLGLSNGYQLIPSVNGQTLSFTIVDINGDTVDLTTLNKYLKFTIYCVMDSCY